MSNRLKQFYRACTAKIISEDLVFVNNWLTSTEITLFLRMSIIDQKHCVNVALTAGSLIIGNEVDKSLLMRSALLHDCGRVNGDLGLLGKVFAVIFDKIFGYGFFNKMSEPNKFSFVYPLYKLLNVYYRHPERSAAALANINCDDGILQIVLAHHKPPTNQDCVELMLLKRADSLN